MIITIYAVYQLDYNGNWDEVRRFKDFDKAKEFATSVCNQDHTPMRVDIDTWEIDGRGRTTIDSSPDAFSVHPITVAA